jgi:hypothetical protein
MRIYARFEVFTTVKIRVIVFWDAMSCVLKDGGSEVLRNIGILPQHYTTWHHNPEYLDLK